MSNRLLTPLLCAGALLAAVLAVPTAAGAAAATVRLTGRADVGATATSPTTVTYTVTVSGRVGNAQLETTVFDSAPVDVDTVRVDGAVVPSGTVGVAAHRMTVRIGAGADAVNGGVLQAGSHLISYVQDHPTDAGKYPTTSGTVYYDLPTGPDNVSSETIVLTHPDLVVTAPGESATLPLGTGRSAVFGGEIANPGATAATTTVKVTLPRGLRVDPSVGVLRYDPVTDTGARLRCSGTTTLACAFGAIAHDGHATVLVPVQPTGKARPGTVGAFRLTVVPTSEPDQAPGNNAVTGRVRYTGVAVLHYAISPATKKVTVGHTDRITLRITNDGPQPAVITLGLAIVEPRHFTIAGYFTRHKVPGPEMFRIPIGSRFGGVVVWNAGTVAAHHTVTAQLTVKAATAGRARIVFYGESQAANPACDRDRPACDQLTVVTLTAKR